MAARRTLLSIVGLLTACSPPAPDAVPADSFAFGVFGDGPYRAWENGRFRRLIADVNRSDLEWLVHVGDILWFPCSDDAFQDRLASLNSVDHPVIYTPGDNEWTDCHEEIAGGYDPLDRLAALRTIFFSDPQRSLGRRSMRLRSQAEDPTYGEFVENARWTLGGFVFTTIHLVGADNGLRDFPGRTSAYDDEVERRTEAAIQWLDEAFAAAQQMSAKGVVLALHGNPGFDDPEPRRGYERFVRRLEEQVAAVSFQVLLIHGDTHDQRVDRPLRDEAGRVYDNFTRLETFGSPDIGWVRVVVDTVAGRITRYEPSRMPGWWW